MEKSLLYFIVKTAALIASVITLSPRNADINLLLITTLSFLCLFLLEVLINKVFGKKQDKAVMATNLVAMIACFMLGAEIYYPLIILIILHLLDIAVDSDMFYSIMGIVILLSAMIFEPKQNAMVISGILLLMLMLGRVLLIKLKIYKEMNERQREALLELNQKITDIKGLNRTLKYTASIEERNRIAARIHDQLGHGISGSIIMLEASMMILKDQPEKAAESIGKSINNLREGVDEIRASLRDERTTPYLIGINDIKATLEEFKVTYNKAAELRTSGELNEISLEIWSCIHDNLKECLTNVLKHSNATVFTLTIEVFKKIIKVEYKDNGTSGEGYEKGLGLEAMEERTIGARGRCFFHKGERSFAVTNIFTC